MLMNVTSVVFGGPLASISRGGKYRRYSYFLASSFYSAAQFFLYSFRANAIQPAAARGLRWRANSIPPARKHQKRPNKTDFLPKRKSESKNGENYKKSIKAE